MAKTLRIIAAAAFILATVPLALVAGHEVLHCIVNWATGRVRKRRQQVAKRGVHA